MTRGKKGALGDLKYDSLLIRLKNKQTRLLIHDRKQQQQQKMIKVTSVGWGGKKKKEDSPGSCTPGDILALGYPVSLQVFNAGGQK